jgi:hypothetical protein
MNYLPLTVNRILPEELTVEINRYLDYLNNGGTGADDCYRTEINVNLNWCRRDHLLPDDIIAKLKNYYVFGGIREGDKMQVQSNLDIIEDTIDFEM